MAKTKHPPRQPPGMTLTDAARAVLEDWPVGTQKVLYEHEVNSNTKRGRHTLAIALGYLKVFGRKESSANSWCRKYRVRRTDKPLPPRRFVKAGSDSIWPWSLPEHWEIVRKCPVQAQHEMFLQMVKKNDDPPSGGNTRAYYREYERKIKEIEEEFPVFGSRSQLGTIRGMLEHLIGTGAFDPCEFSSYSIPMICTPDRILKTFAAMLVAPVIEGGRIVRFVPMPPDRQLDELGRLRGQFNIMDAVVSTYQSLPAAGQDASVA